MKHLLAVVTLLLLFSCSEKQKETKDDSEWKEMEDFHTVMADVYHPLKDSNNLQPIKQNADQLADAAKKWKDAELPAKVDNDETKKQLNELSDGTEQLKEAIRKGDTDEIIAAKLTIIHDTFHSIMESWYKSGKEEGAEEGHHDH